MAVFPIRPFDVYNKCRLIIGMLSMLIYEETPYLICHHSENNTTKYLLSPRRERIEVRGDTIWRSTPLRARGSPSGAEPEPAATFTLWSMFHYSTGRPPPSRDCVVIGSRNL